MKALKTLAACILILSVSNVYAQSVTFDPTFGQDGMTVIPGTSEIHYLDFDKLGNIIAIGTNDTYSHLTIAKTNADGIFDQTFGINGVVEFYEYTWSRWAAFGLKITNENKILIFGIFVIDGSKKPMLLQFNEDGSIDESFGDQGKVILNHDPLYVESVNIENDDFMLIGYLIPHTGPCTISKYSYSGKLDESFGESGIVYLTDNQTFYIVPRHIKILRDQSIFVAGDGGLSYETEVAFCKLSPNGEFVTGFANNGVWSMDLISGDMFQEYFKNTIEDNDGNLILLGGILQSYGSFIAKFNSNGVADSSFGNNTFGQPGFYGIPERYWPAENILLHEKKYLIGACDRVISINSNGTLDTNFNNTGVFIVYENSTPGDGDYFHDMKLQAPGKLVLVGTSSNFSIARLNIPPNVSVKPYPYVDNSITIFPNPVKDILYFNTENRFEIFDILGKTVLKSEKTIQSVNVSRLKAGIYFIKFENNQIKKFIKE